ncbi:hypothetical protein QYM36_006035 [Artemia franciscana]|uniref:Uncharacterized protein n=1 Tax=Artemia franciscana TaxID=6661 RepID=A0AA88L6K2_ARTSF|nr:hypothetical protein QYM36_006035 [Artemia franciscana]
MSDADSDIMRSVGNRKLVYLPVLNLTQTKFKSGIDDEVIIKYAVEFFDGPVIFSAKVEFWNTCNNDIQPTKRIGAKAASNNVKTILDLMR